MLKRIQHQKSIETNDEACGSIRDTEVEFRKRSSDFLPIFDGEFTGIKNINLTEGSEFIKSQSSRRRERKYSHVEESMILANNDYKPKSEVVDRTGRRKTLKRVNSDVEQPKSS